ncbi:two-component system OmpR family response regulator [Arthrobacter sp. UYNi723]
MNSRGICLVIEDDLDIRHLLCLILTGAGFKVHAEATGAAGLRAAKRLDLALITLDLGLPDLDGHDVARQIRTLSKAPLLMITAYTEPSDELDGMSAGANAYLTKPFRTAQLRALVQKLCPPSPVTTPAPGAAGFRTDG